MNFFSFHISSEPQASDCEELSASCSMDKKRNTFIPILRYVFKDASQLSRLYVVEF